jgi:hypothetical protein
LISPDKTFASLERNFLLVRDKLIADEFKNWREDLDFLLSFMDMIRARSPLFLAQKEVDNRALRGWTVKSVGPGPNKITLESMEAAPMSETWIRNRAIVQMREEILKGPAWTLNFHWCLRYTRSTTDPVITCDHPVSSAGPRNSRETFLSDPDTFVYLPICWQACLIGNLCKFDVDTDEFVPSTLKFIRDLYRTNASEYLISPQPISF